MYTPEILIYFARLIEKETGIIYEDHNLFQLQDRLANLVISEGFDSITEMVTKTKSDFRGEFKQRFIDVSTNNETSFFRDTRFFECITKTILPGLVAGKKLDSLNIWSVASSTGQEPYSLAILLHEMSEKINQSSPCIFATDISQRVLSRAMEAKFSELEIKRGLSAVHLQKYFTADIKNVWHLNSKLRESVKFQCLNLLTPFSLPQQFDLILCRNVLIYQRVEAKKEIIRRISQCLRPGGIFLLGSGESLMGLSTDFDQSLTDGVAVYRRKLTSTSAA